MTHIAILSAYTLIGVPVIILAGRRSKTEQPPAGARGLMPPRRFVSFQVLLIHVRFLVAGHSVTVRVPESAARPSAAEAP